MTAEMIQIVLDYAEEEYYKIEDHVDEAENWEHDGFCLAYATKQLTNETERMWGSFKFPEEWMGVPLICKALSSTKWFMDEANEMLSETERKKPKTTTTDVRKILTGVFKRQI